MIKSGLPARLKYDSDDYNRSLCHQTDARIYEDIFEALLNDSMVDSSDIGVEVRDGVVTLTGHLDNREMKKEVEVCIEHVEGIVDVFNLINLHQFRDAGSEGLIKNQARLDP